MMVLLTSGSEQCQGAFPFHFNIIVACRWDVDGGLVDPRVAIHKINSSILTFENIAEEDFDAPGLFPSGLSCRLLCMK